MSKQLYLYIVFLLFFAGKLSAQSTEQKADSLLALIENTSLDTAKANHYIVLGTMYLYSEPDKAVKFLHKGLALSSKTEFDIGLGNCYSFLFNVHDVLGSHSDSLLFYIKSMEALYEKTKNIKYKIKTHWNYGVYYRNLGQNDKVIEAYLTTLDLIEKHNYPQLEKARILGNIGTSLDFNENYEEALGYYQQAAPLFEDDKIGQAITYFNMAIIYSRQWNNVDTALEFLNKAYLLSEEIDHKSLMAGILIEKGYCNDVKGQFERANELYQQALQISKKYNLGENFVEIYSAFSEHYLERKQYLKAIEYSDKAIQGSKEKEDYRILSSLYEVQETAYLKLGNYKNAHEAKTKLTVHLDSLNNADVKERIEDIQTKYEVEQKEGENKLLKLDLKSRQRFSIILIIALLFAVAFGIAIFRSSQQRKKYNQILEQKVAERTKALEQANYELRTFNYIASHDIKEPIRNVGNYAGLIFRKLPDDLKSSLGSYFETIKNSTTQLYTLIEDFSKYTTFSRNQTIQKQDINLNELVNSLESMEVNTEDNRKIINHGLPIVHSNLSFLYTIFKNIINNGLKYNQSPTPTVELSYNETATHHEITISDNGIGISEEYHEKIFEMFKRLHHRGEYEGSGIGLAIVKLAIDKIEGKISLESEIEKGSQFTISIPKS